MKKLITTVLFFTIVMSYGQKKSIKGDLKGDMRENALKGNLKDNVNKDVLNGISTPNQSLNIENSISIHVNVNSTKELESTFTIEDIKEIMNTAKQEESIVFKITCNKQDELKREISYTVKGTIDEEEKFLKDVELIKEKAIQYFKSK